MLENILKPRLSRLTLAVIALDLGIAIAVVENVVIGPGYKLDDILVFSFVYGWLAGLVFLGGLIPRKQVGFLVVGSIPLALVAFFLTFFGYPVHLLPLLFMAFAILK